MPFSASPKFPTAVAQVGDLLNQINYVPGETVPSLASGITSGSSSLSVATGTGANLPTDNFEITIDSEIIFVLSRTGDVLSGLVRGAEGTVAASHNAGVTVNAFMTALHHNQAVAEINAIEANLPPGLVLGPDVAPLVAGSFDDEFPGSSLSGAWSIDNQSTATYTVSGSRLKISYSGAGTGIQVIYKSAPATPWEVTAGPFHIGSVNSGTLGIALRDGTGSIVQFVQYLSSNTVENILVGYWTNSTTFSSNPLITVFNFPRLRYLKIKDDGANLTFSASSDGVTWWQVLQTSRTAFFAAGPTQVGLAFGSPGTTGLLSVDWIRRTL